MTENIINQMSDKELEEWIAEDYANMYCCSPECLDLPYIDAGL